MTEEAGRYAGLTVEEARRAILEDLRREGSLVREEGLVQSVGVCWRCKTPVEILTKKQWFMRVLDLAERVVEEARKVRWVPEYMGQRLVDWVRSMDWDWVISRQRIFATPPIPVWYCRKCGEVVVAEEDQLPVDPQRDRPRGRCPRCGGRSSRGRRTCWTPGWTAPSPSPCTRAGPSWTAGSSPPTCSPTVRTSSGPGTTTCW